MTANNYLQNALSDIEKLMGEGAAERYPQIVAAYLNAAAIDCGATIIAQQIRLGLDAVADEIANKTNSDESGGNIRGGLDGLAEATQNIAAMLDTIGMNINRLVNPEST
jgi:hypothetical protein